jgi:hypothetical protein
VGITNGDMHKYPTQSLWYTNDAGREDGIIIDYQYSGGCDTFALTDPGEDQAAVVRCFRQL